MAHTIIDSCIGCGACVGSCPALAITGKAKEVHIIDSDRCVDCSVCGYICPVGSIVSAQEIVVKSIKSSNREKPRVLQESCTACSLCIDICRFQALILSKPREQGDIRAWAETIHSKCVGCRLCQQVCPVEAIIMEVAQ